MYKTIDLFAGIGDIRLDFEAYGCENVLSSELDKDAQSMYKANYNYLVVNVIGRLTDREMLRLQGFPDDFKINVPYSAVRKMAGNWVSVPVIKAIAEQMIKALKMQKIVVQEPMQFLLYYAIPFYKS